MLNLLSLFSGIGAFEKALERNGIPFNLLNYCEIDKEASKSYSAVHNVPETLNLRDVNVVERERELTLSHTGFHVKTFRAPESK